MQNKIRERSFLILVPLLLALPFVNIVGAESESDMAITSQVVDKLQGDSELMGSRIHVETIEGEVTLKGTVQSLGDITRAGMLAGSIEGVKKVDNRLKREKVTTQYGGSSRAPDCPVGANWAC